MTKARERALAAIALMVIVAIFGAWWHLTGDCGSVNVEAPFAACRRIEDNQGLLSILALGFAIVALVLENNRANRAELRAQQTAFEAQERVRRQSIVREMTAIRGFFRTARAIIADCLNARLIVVGDQPPSKAGRWPDTQDVARRTSSALRAIVAAAPLDSDIHFLLQRTLEAIDLLGQQAATGEKARALAALDKIATIKGEFDVRENALMNAKRFELKINRDYMGL